MTEYVEFPCVGGPMHGKRLRVRQGARIVEVPLMRKLGDMRFAGSFKADAEPYERFSYRVATHYTRDGKGGEQVVTFLVPADVSEIHTFAFVLERALALPMPTTEF
jgi:hypothetical protein